MAVSDRTRAAVQGQLDAERNRRNLDTAKASGERKIFETRMAAKAEAEDIARVADVIVAALTKASGQTMTGVGDDEGGAAATGTWSRRRWNTWRSTAASRSNRPRQRPGGRQSHPPQHRAANTMNGQRFTEIKG